MPADLILPWRILDSLAEIGAERDLEGFCRKAFEGLLRLIPHDSAYHLRLDPARHVLPSSTCTGVSGQYRQAYLDYYHRLDPIVPSLPLAQWPTRLDYRDMQGTEFYTDFIRPQGPTVACSIYLRDRQCRPRSLMTINRHGRASLADQEVDLMWRIRPHLENLYSGLHALGEFQAELRFIAEAAADCRLLSKREAEVAALLCRRLTANEIAARLLISPLTARKHIENIYEKLGVKSRGELVGRLLGSH